MTYNHALMAAIDNNNVNDFWNILYNDDAFVSKDIAYDPEWANGTGYYDGAVKADMAELGVGQVGRSRSPAPNNRRILIVKTRYGNVVVFERMTPAEDGTLKGPITINMPDMIRHTELIGTEGPLTIDQLVSIFGNGVQPVYNVGVRLEHLLTYMKQGGRLTKNLRFRRFEAILLMAHNFKDMFAMIQGSPTQMQAVDALLSAPWEVPLVIREAHEHNSIPFRTDGYGLTDKGLYRLTKWQAEALLNLSFDEFLGSNLDVLNGQYYQLAKDLNPAAHKLSESMEASH